MLQTKHHKMLVKDSMFLKIFALTSCLHVPEAKTPFRSMSQRSKYLTYPHISYSTDHIHE